MFSDRLDFLMDLADVQNNALARAVSLDASYVSRLRSGQRPLPAKQSYVMPMARYLAHHIKLPYQREAACRALHLEASWPEDEQHAALLLCAWLLGKQLPPPTESVGMLLDRLAMARPAVPPNCRHQQHTAPAQSPPKTRGNVPPPPAVFYYGVEGKRQAALRFLSSVSSCEQPQTLLLFSDEEMSWLTGDPAYTARWATALTEVLAAGNRIRIVHTVTRNVDEMILGVAKWLPIYMTGSIEPLYYPGPRDGLFQRTLFIAPITAAIVANSTNREPDGLLNVYLEGQDALDALVLEFNRYAACCCPLMRVSTSQTFERFWECALELAAADEPLVFVGPAPSLASMPREVAHSISKRRASGKLLQLWEQLASQLEKRTTILTEIFPTHESSAVEHGIELPLGQGLTEGGTRYTPEEYRAHIQHARMLTSENAPYRIHEMPLAHDNILVCASKNAGAVIARLDVPTVVFALDEPGMTNAIWEYFSEHGEENTRTARET